MRKHILFTFLLVFTGLNLYSQLSLHIKNIRVSDIKVIMHNYIPYFHKDYGPTISVDFYLYNNTDRTIKLSTEKSKILYEIAYKDTTYICTPICASPFPKRDVILEPNQKISGDFITCLFVNKHNLDKSKPCLKPYSEIDYTREVIEVVPTIRVLFIDKLNKHMLYSSRTLNVEIVESNWESFWQK